MKYCTKCDSNKAVTEFYSKGKEKRTSSWCKSCFNSYCIERWIQRKLKVINKFGDKCLDCDKQYHYAVYEFHHLDPSTKETSWTKMRLMSEARMQKELSKCVMLCANCHRLRHAELRLSS